MTFPELPDGYRWSVTANDGAYQIEIRRTGFWGCFLDGMERLWGALLDGSPDPRWSWLALSTENAQDEAAKLHALFLRDIQLPLSAQKIEDELNARH